MATEEKHTCVKCGKEFTVIADEIDKNSTKGQLLCPTCYKEFREQRKKKWK